VIGIRLSLGPKAIFGVHPHFALACGVFWRFVENATLFGLVSMERVNALCKHLIEEEDTDKVLLIIGELRERLEKNHIKLMHDFDELQKVSSERFRKLQATMTARSDAKE
jgi:hypothetical protein